jgi:hypothetical protein
MALPQTLGRPVDRARKVGRKLRGADGTLDLPRIAQAPADVAGDVEKVSGLVAADDGLPAS